MLAALFVNFAEERRDRADGGERIPRHVIGKYLRRFRTTSFTYERSKRDELTRAIRQAFEKVSAAPRDKTALQIVAADFDSLVNNPAEFDHFLDLYAQYLDEQDVEFLLMMEP